MTQCAILIFTIFYSGNTMGDLSSFVTMTPAHPVSVTEVAVKTNVVFKVCAFLKKSALMFFSGYCSGMMHMLISNQVRIMGYYLQASTTVPKTPLSGK